MFAQSVGRGAWQQGVAARGGGGSVAPLNSIFGAFSVRKQLVSFLATSGLSFVFQLCNAELFKGKSAIEVVWRVGFFLSTLLI